MVTIWVNLATPAAAAETVPVALPPGEDSEGWRNAFALAGLRVAPPGITGPGAELRAGAGTWTGWVRDEKGVIHPLTVPAPDDRADREALAALIASMARSVRSAPVVRLPPVPTPPAATPRPVDRPLAVTSPVAPTEPAQTETAPVPGAVPLAVVDVIAPDEVSPEEWLVPVARETRLWFGGGATVKKRWAFRTAAGGAVWLGAARSARSAHAGGAVGWRVGAGVEVVAPSALIRVGETMGAVDVCGLAAVTVGRWDLGAVGGPSVRWYPNPELDPNFVLVPTVGGTFGYNVPIGGTTVRVGLGLGWDTRRVEVCPAEEECPTPRASASLGIQLLRL